ncbi:IS5/IS1182 family transposase [Treponema endosymbiont of Eucomonympha sp.]|uniref:IS5/IS1182 family transposase n=1 Tax=Treponema endosymbiont of Eucomonympha sp. TaxID=1580831 RepID=UPI000750E9AC|nr:IS5/IS1182 family transposase [Treponema endosymbiont of Eucomonympha sp.]
MKENEGIHRHDISDEARERIKELLPGQAGKRGGAAKGSRLFINAAAQQTRTGAPWRDIPPEFGNWNSIHKRFCRWRDKGIWKRLADAAIGEPAGDIRMIDSTYIKAHADACGAHGGTQDISRINRELNPKLHIDISKIPTLTLDASQTRLRADMSPILNGQADLQKCTDIDLQKLEAGLRLQRIVFLAAGEVYEMMKDKTTATWEHEGTKFALLGQIITIVEQYLKFGKIVVEPVLFEINPLRRKILFMANMNLIVQHLWSYIRFKHSEKIIPVFDPNKKVRSTADMPTWYTIKPNFPTKNIPY